MDYAMNTATYTVEAQIGGGAAKLPHLIAYDTVVNEWIGFDTDTPMLNGTALPCATTFTTPPPLQIITSLPS